jgi:hypothetical protein
MLQVYEEGTVGERVQKLIDHFAHGNKSAFGRAADLPSALLASIVGGRQSKPSFEVVQRLLTAYPTVEPSWLLFGQGPMLTGSPAPVGKYSGSVGQVPVLSTQDDIPVIIFKDRQLKYFFKRHEEFKPELVTYYEEDALQSISFPRSLLGNGFYYGFPVMNTMMEPLFEYGDIIIAKQVNRENWFQIARKSIVIVTSKSHPYLIGIFGLNKKQSAINLSFNEKSWHDISLSTDDIYEIWEFKWLLSSHGDKLSKDTAATKLTKAFQKRSEEINNEKTEQVFENYSERLRHIILTNELYEGMLPGDHLDLANDKEVIRLFEAKHGDIENHQEYLDTIVLTIDSIIQEINKSYLSKK